MSLVETLAGTIVGVVGGSFLGYGFSILRQNRSQRLQRTEMARERIYSPLYDEVTDTIQRITEGERPTTDEWNRVSKTNHLSYLIDDDTLQHLKEFYGATSHTLNGRADACTTHYSELVLADLYERLGTNSNDTARTVSQFVGYSLHLDIIPEQLIRYHSRSYNELKAGSPSRFTHETLADYFQWWKEKTRKDKEIVEYQQARSQALRKAESLRAKLSGKLGAGTQTLKTSLSVSKLSGRLRLSSLLDKGLQNTRKRILRRVVKVFLLSAGLFSIVGLSRYFDKVWQDNAPTTPNPLDPNWMFAIIIAVTTGAIIFGMLSVLAPAGFKVISKMLGMDETEKDD